MRSSYLLLLKGKGQGAWAEATRTAIFCGVFCHWVSLFLRSVLETNSKREAAS